MALIRLSMPFSVHEWHCSLHECHYSTNQWLGGPAWARGRLTFNSFWTFSDFMFVFNGNTFYPEPINLTCRVATLWVLLLDEIRTLSVRLLLS